MSSPRDQLLEWLLAAESRDLSVDRFLEAFASRVREAGIPLCRMTTSVRTLHPEVFVRTVRWVLGAGVTVVEVPHSIQQTSDYLGSPVEEIHRGSPPFRVRLEGTAPLAYPQLEAIRRAGGTDYFILPLPLSSQRLTYLSVATDRPGGFGDEQLQLLRSLSSAVALRLEVDSAHYATRSLLNVYLGQHAAERVLCGAFQRGTGQELEAAIFFCDMRGFSTFSDSAPMREVVATLDAYFQRLAGPIGQHGGEILKFIGDAVLAIFPVGTDPGAACGQALSAAREGISAVHALGDELAASGGPRVRAGAAVHRGRVLYGNIGAQQRLDFTVIGPAVNEAARIEALCKELGEPVLVSDEVARLVPADRLRSLGTHVLRGIRAGRELFAPSEE